MNASLSPTLLYTKLSLVMRRGAIKVNEPLV
jgi:hypothetical protein